MVSRGVKLEDPHGEFKGQGRAHFSRKTSKTASVSSSNSVTINSQSFDSVDRLSSRSRGGGGGAAVVARWKLFQDKRPGSLKHLKEEIPYIADIIHTEERDASTRPLLLAEESGSSVGATGGSQGNNYMSFSVSTASVTPNFGPTLETISETATPKKDIATSKSVKSSSPKIRSSSSRKRRRRADAFGKLSSNSSSNLGVVTKHDRENNSSNKVRDDGGNDVDNNNDGEDDQPLLPNSDDDNDSDKESSSTDDDEAVDDFDKDFEPVYEHQPVDKGLSTVLAAVRQQSLSMSMSQQAGLGDFHSRKLAQLSNPKLKVEDEKRKSKYMTKRLTILCVSTFFTMGTMIGISMYAANALTIGIMDGDPLSAPGTEGRDRYERGMRYSALGNLVLYGAYAFISINNTKIIETIGVRAQFVLCHAFLIISLLTLLATKMIETYYVFMVFTGVYRTSVFTLPFVLANNIVQESMVSDQAGGAEEVNPDKPVAKIGRVMTLIGVLLPSHYILMSIFMGPLMEATGDVWQPLKYSLGNACVSLCVFTSMFFVKP